MRRLEELPARKILKPGSSPRVREPHAMRLRRSVRGMILLGLVACTGVGTRSVSGAESRPPNVVLMVTDDQGYGDLGCHGNPIVRTPNIDRLHGQSVRLTNFHVDPTCSPTRSALMT